MNPNLNLSQARQILESTTDKLSGYTFNSNVTGQPNGSWNNEVGYGRVNAYNAVLKAAGGPILGPDLVCTSNGPYTLQGALLAGSVTWSTDNSTYLIMSGSTAIRQNNANGLASIKGTITGSCSSLTKPVWVGQPLVTNQKVDGGSYYTGLGICPGNHYLNVSTPTIGGASTAIWTVQSGVPYVSSGNNLNFTMYNNVSSISITAKSTNACAVQGGPNTSFYLTKKSFGCSAFLSVNIYPNPISNELFVETTIIDELDNSTSQLIADEIMLIDSNGNMIFKANPTISNPIYDLSKIQKGEYFLEVRVGLEVIKHRILIN